MILFIEDTHDKGEVLSIFDELEVQNHLWKSGAREDVFSNNFVVDMSVTMSLWHAS